MTTKTTTTNWTPQQISQLRTLYPDMPTNQVAKVLGYSTSTIYRQAAALGIKKSQAFNESEHSGRIQRGRDDPRMVATQFQPGFTPWNKGVPGVWLLGTRPRMTVIKPAPPSLLVFHMSASGRNAGFHSRS